MKELVFEKTAEAAVLPTRGHSTDAGFDLYVCEPETLTFQPNWFYRVGTGVRVSLKPEEWGLILGRSSTLAHHGLLVAPGVVDPGYEGELMLAVQNLSNRAVEVRTGLRLAQFILMGNLNLNREPVWGSVLNQGLRGSNGFGSTGA